MAATWTGTLWQWVLGTSWQSSYGTCSMFMVRKDQIIFFLFHFNLHRMLYGDVMAMFLGINLTVLVVAIPGKLSLWHIHIGMERAAIEIRTRDTLSHGEPCISFCTGFHTWSCNGSCSMACIPVKSPVFSWNWLTTCFFLQYLPSHTFHRTLLHSTCGTLGCTKYGTGKNGCQQKVFVLQWNLLNVIELPK